MQYKVLSPWGQVDHLSPLNLQPRVPDLNNRTIGLFAFFKEHGPLILREVEKQLKARFSNARFSHYQYPRDTTEIINDPNFKGSFEKWLSQIDTVISAHGDAGSCAMFLAYNTAAIEMLGKPAVMLVNKSLVNPARQGAALRRTPGLRLVSTNIPDLSSLPSLNNVLENTIRPGITTVIDKIIAALVEPLSEVEQTITKKVEKEPRIVFTGTLEEVCRFFYKKGWSYGMPIIPPTQEAVNEMLTGTDLPPDRIIARISPRFGKATVEKIAINAVMAGCLPTAMPVLIAVVQAMMDPKIHLEGWTCSVASWAPLLIINGPIRHDLHVNSGVALMSPYYRANATIGHALGLIIMNVGGVRPGLEDNSVIGHEGRFGMCIAENEEASPWNPLHTDYGLKKDDSSVTLFWPSIRMEFKGNNAVSMLSALCNIESIGFDPGGAFIMTPEYAQILASEGWTKKDIISYIIEYSRKPASEFNIRWLKANNHLPKTVPLPVNPAHSTRRFFSDEHVFIVVAGGGGIRGEAYCGGGDHGGPVSRKILLPGNWKDIAGRYQDIKPDYTRC
jgi:hypothetical protein